jgi:hypothetical protein
MPSAAEKIRAFKEKEVRDVKPVVEPSKWYLPDRVGFVKFVNKTFSPLQELPRDADATEFQIFPQQAFVRDYLEMKSPYRGLLLYHGLGVGKTCASIAAAEILINYKKVKVLVPASLRSNYVSQVQYCGHRHYTTKQKWRFLPKDEIESLKSVKYVSRDIIQKHKGLWYSKEGKSNFHKLSAVEQKQIVAQIEDTIQKQYSFIHYNGLKRKNLLEMTETNTVNPFDDCVVIVDEVHNLIAQLFGKGTIAKSLYNLILSAKNAKVILLSGTPIINRPVEIAHIINLVKGYEKVYEMSYQAKEGGPNAEAIERALLQHSRVDRVALDVKNKRLSVKLTPPFFAKASKGRVSYDELKEDEAVISELADVLKGIKVNTSSEHKVLYFKPLPDTDEEFNKTFVKERMDGNERQFEVANADLFMRRALGAVSYFTSADQDLYPQVRQREIVKVPLSDVQFKEYLEAREKERDREKGSKKNEKEARMRGLMEEEEASSLFKAFSRAISNFVFPAEIPRPYPSTLRALYSEMDQVDELSTDNVQLDEKIVTSKPVKAPKEKKAKKKASSQSGGSKKRRQEPDPTSEEILAAEEAIDDVVFIGKEKEEEPNVEQEYQRLITSALKKLAAGADNYLSENLQLYSPKYAALLERLLPLNGTAMIYSQFRKVEGLGIISLVLNAHGFAEFKLKRGRDGMYELDMRPDDIGKQHYIAFTNDKELTEVLLSIFNWDLGKMPQQLQDQLTEAFPGMDNIRGDIIKVLMITQSGSEGINLKNVRQVHIMEPYWNQVRVDQVIGRAVRTKSHFALPKEDQNVDVHLYASTFTKKQLVDNVTLRNLDKSKTSDESILSIAERKAAINNSLLDLVKRAAVDCELNKRHHPGVQCYSFPVNLDEGAYGIEVDIAKEVRDKEREQLIEKVVFKPKMVKIQDQPYVFIPETKELCDYEKYIADGVLEVVGWLEKDASGKFKRKLLKKKQI